MLKNYTLFCVLLFSLVCVLSCNDDDLPEPAPILITEQVDSLATIVLKVSNIMDAEGNMNIALYDNKDTWDVDVDNQLTENEHAFAYPEISSLEDLEVTFDDIEPGVYAFSIFHDVDSSGEINISGSIIPLPREPYGFSNNFVPVLSSPDWSDCTFEVNYFDSLELEIQLIEGF